MNWLPAMKRRPTRGRRTLSFTCLDEVMPDVQRLLAGHVAVGRWTLGQICHHLATTIRMSHEGIPEKAPWLLRRTAGVLLRRLTFWRGWIPEGVSVPAVFLPGSDFDSPRQAESLRVEIDRFRTWPGPFDEHPLLGRMTCTQWERFHCIHCAHHLSFVVPASA